MSVRKRVGLKFRDEIAFLKGWKRDRTSVGAIAPTSTVTARKMASVVHPGSGLPVLELGPGTGVITKEILARGIAPQNLTSIEYSPEFCQHLRSLFPQVDIRCGDAFALDLTLGGKRAAKFDCVISAIPLLHLPVDRRLALVLDLLERVPVGRPVVQITYGLSPRSWHFPPAMRCAIWRSWYEISLRPSFGFTGKFRRLMALSGDL